MCLCERLCLFHGAERARIIASPLQAETTENITPKETTQMPQTFKEDNGTQDNVTQSDAYFWIVLTLIMIGIGLVLIGGWLGRARLGQCGILGMLLHLIV